MTPITGPEIDALCVSCHADNVAAGWWSDLATGESLIGRRNIGELLMLCVSEICEGAEGLADRLMDDKLPHRQMIEVELADFCIRVFDLSGALRLPLGLNFKHISATVLTAQAYGYLDNPNDHLLRMIRFVSEAMEHHRKGRPAEMAIPLAYALHGAFILGEALELDVMAAAAEKREFNSSRSDHQVENRRAAGGKA